jgi:murein DD-endopeptidase MepM/ murein hydrolase activator NlpD
MSVAFLTLRRIASPLRSVVAILIAGSLAACSADPARLTEQAVSPAPKPRALASAPGGRWIWDGGTGLVVRPGETVNTIARRHHVPASAIIEVNNLSSSGALRVGQRLVLPSYRVSTPAAGPELAGTPLRPPAEVGNAGTAAPVASAAPPDLISSHPVRRSSPAPATPKVAAATHHKITTGVPKKSPAVSKAALTPTPVGPRLTASLKPGDASQVFSWPARGPVVTGFGVRVENGKSDGIDIAVPEETPIKAADDGVVVYAGSALESYGNLVLLRHADDYVSVYAHAKTLRVKQGDKVKRGDIIGESGQTGDAKEPRLHFEVRKFSVPIDPLPLLDGA